MDLPQRFKLIKLFIAIVFGFSSLGVAQAQVSDPRIIERTIPIIFYLLDEDAGSLSPAVMIDSPTEGQVFAPGEPVVVNVSASDTDGTIAKVDLWVNGVLLNSDITAPYQWSGGVLDTLASGQHTLLVEATDNLGNSASVSRNITVSAANQPPTVDFILPTVTTFVEGEPVLVEATANDADGNVANVELYLDGVLVRQEVNPPYTWNDESRGADDPALDSLSVGQHTLSLVATDNDGAQTSLQRVITVTAANQAPTVGFILPTQTTFSVGASVIVEASASDADGSIASVDLFLNNVLVRRESFAPYTWNDTGRGSADPVLDSLTVGQHILRLVATDNEGVETASELTITVQGNTVNQPPAVNFSSPTAGQTFTQGNAVSITANASDSDGSIARVDLYIDGVFDSSDVAAPYSWSVNDLPVGTRTLRVVAVDDDAAESFAEISITIADSNPSGDVQAHILPSRTECASPCTVVFSAERTTAIGLDDHGVWSQLSYYWDFDTDETDTYGHLYEQQYRYVEGDTASEKGHVPMATKTFLCEAGTCTYNVGMRAQNIAGDFDDDFVTITVESESTAWSALDTVCISNTLDLNSDWASFDKSCPQGAMKQNVMLDYDQYDGKLVLFKKGDVFTHTNGSSSKLPIVIATLPNQSNFKLGVFGDEDEQKPYLDGLITFGKTNFGGPRNAPSAANTSNLTDALVELYGWPENIYIEGLKAGGVDFPMSFEHIGVHDLDMDSSDSNATGAGGRIGVAAGSTQCHSSSTLSCSNVPFPKGGYISSVDIVGGGENGPGLNMGQTQCAMVNFLGITDTRLRRAYEHNLRIAGWYRTNIMRSFFRGEHLQPVNNGKNSKITLRSCNRSGGDWERGVWFTDPHRPLSWDRDVMEQDGTMRTRLDADATTSDPNEVGFGEHFHVSRYQVIAHNKLGEFSPNLPQPEGVIYATNLSRSFPEDIQGQQDIMLSHNTFERQEGGNGGAIITSAWMTCVANNDPEACAPTFVSAEMPNYRREPTPTPVPAAPGSN